MSSLIDACKELFLSQVPIAAAAEVLFWLVYLIIQKPQLVDVAWGFVHLITGFMLATDNLTNLAGLSNSYNQIYVLLLFLWSFRLGGYLIVTRILPSHIDPRYAALDKKHQNKSLYYLFQYVFQGVLSVITSFSLYYLFQKKPKSFAINDYLGIILIAVGIIGEHLADQQLHNYREKPNKDDKKKTFRGGLWKKSRHPNLFFDLVIWSGFAISSLELNNLGDSIWTLIGPVSLWAIMNFVTIPISERYLKKSRADYEQVKKETNKFIPF